MPMQVISGGWRIRRSTRGRAGGADDLLPAFPQVYLTPGSRVAEEAVLEQVQPTRGQPVGGGLDLICDVEADQVALFAIRHPSGALTFHLPTQSASRALRGPSQARFQIPLRPPVATRGVVSWAVKAILIKAAKLTADKLVSLLLPAVVATFERQAWRKRGLNEGWVRMTKDGLASDSLPPGVPVSPERSLLFIHGTFSNSAAAFRSLASSTFFERIKRTYDDRIFAFDHFTLSRTPEENARMLLEALPDHTTIFDVITHSRGGLVLRTIAEQPALFKQMARRFKLDRAVLVAAPNEGTPLATPVRWDRTVGWLANLLELFPDNPLTTGVEFVANGLVWMAHHASGDIPGLHAMDANGETIRKLQGESHPPRDAYSALVANYQPVTHLRRLLDVGLDEFFGSANDLVVPSEGGWRVDRASTAFIPASRIGCFGPGGNLRDDSVTHLSFFSRPESVDFLANALEGRRQPLNAVDPRAPLPDHRVFASLRNRTGSPATRAAAEAGAVETRRPSGTAGQRLRISIINGDLMFEPEPLLLGHYASIRLTGTEKVMDTLVNGVMQRALALGLYPLTVGSHEIFLNLSENQVTKLPRPKAVIVVGLGAEGSLRAADLVKSVRLAVIGWARQVAESKRSAREPFTLASTLIGSGGTGMSAGQAAQLLARGVWEANNALREAAENDGPTRGIWPWCAELRITELYLDRATEAWHALRMQREVAPGHFELAPLIKRGGGALLRPPDSGYRGAEYDFVTVESTGRPLAPTVEFTLHTRRAREEVRGKCTQTKLIRRLVATASDNRGDDTRIGQTLFRLLIPVELEPYLTGNGEMVMALDPNTAAIPWELLDPDRDRRPGQYPWSIEVKLLRKLKVDRFRERVMDPNAEDSVLIVGEPQCPPEYPRIEAARNEAIAVHRLLSGEGCFAPVETAAAGDAASPNRAKVTLLASEDPTQPGPDAEEVINTLFERPWRIVHIAGHGELAFSGRLGGVVLSNRTFLGPAEIRSMNVVPELVFINCCYLGRADDAQLLNPRYDRVRFASGVAGALIEIGVRCVVAAGWAVNDEVASVFASTFYAAILRNQSFIEAVGCARRAAYDDNPSSNTWAAYQCYGDPDWRLRTHADKQGSGSTEDDAPSIASAPALILELERIAVGSSADEHDLPGRVNALHKLEGLFGRSLGRDGEVAEAFARAFRESGAMEDAIRWYERAVGAPDGRASFRAPEQLANARCRHAWESVEKALRQRDDLVRLAEDPKTSGRDRAAFRRAARDADRSLARLAREGSAAIEESLTLLEDLARLKLTAERANLVGSAFERRALINLAAGRWTQTQRDLRQMRQAYLKALHVAEAEGADTYYPASNCLAADAALDSGAARPHSLGPSLERIVRKSLDGKLGIHADFWSEVGDIELAEYQALAKRRLNVERRRLEARYRELYKRVPSPRMWSSVYDTSYMVLGCHTRIGSPASASERRAATGLLDTLRGLAHGQRDGMP